MTEENESSRDIHKQVQHEKPDFHYLTSKVVDDIDDIDDDTFELPLKTRYTQSNNFSELEAFPSASSFEKRVRFEGQLGETPLTISEMNIHDLPDVDASTLATDTKSTTTSMNFNKKPHIEELIQHAHSLNSYLDQNMDKINTFRSKLLGADSYDDDNCNNNASTAATAPTTTSGSVSNFELSDSDQSDFPDDEQYIHDRRVVKLQTYDENEDHMIKDILSKHQPMTYPLSENPSSMDLDKERGDYSENLSGNASICTSMGSFSNDLHTVPSSPTFKRNSENIQDHSLSFNEQRPPLISTDCDVDPPDMNSDAALAIFSKTISILLEMAKQIPEEEESDLPSFLTFMMKAPPTMIYEHYLQRLHSKFCFAPIVYLTATYLLECLILARSEKKLKLKFGLHLAQVHRLIIASIRLATKLLEDCVHSHAYFSRVCGISKRLLTKLEVALLECLNYEGLKITNSNLIMAIKVYEELCIMAK